MAQDRSSKDKGLRFLRVKKIVTLAELALPCRISPSLMPTACGDIGEPSFPDSAICLRRSFSWSPIPKLDSPPLKQEICSG